MSFRLFIYYCAAWGAANAYFGWALGQMIEGTSPLLGAALKALALGLFIALGLGLLDALAGGSQRDTVALGVRVTLALLIGALAGFCGGFIGQGFYQLFDGKWPSLLVLGWTLMGLLIGAAPAAFDFLAAVLRNEDRRGARNKLRNGLIGGSVGGLLGGVVSLLLHALWGHVFPSSDPRGLWLPSATGFVALGACIGLSVALAQIILREAWLRVESGFRPGRQILLTRPETTIGRAESCDVGLFGDSAVEKFHARIIRDGDQWVLTDAGTAAGTLVNGQRITAPTPLRSGDRIGVGSSVLSFGVRMREAVPLPTPLPLPA
jgi:MFS family permease